MDLTPGASKAQSTVCAFDPDDPATVADPYAAYGWLRREEPVYYVPEHDLWAVTRYADVVAVLSDPRRFSSKLGMGAQRRLLGARAVDYRIGAPGVRVLIATDPPEHTAFRSLVSAPFRAPAMAKLAPRIEELARRLVAELVDSDDVDLYRDLAAPLPVLVLAELFGVPPDMRGAFREWASVVTDDLRAPGADGAEPDEAALLGRGYGMFRYFWREIRDRRANPKDDLLGVVATADSAGLSDYEIMAFCAFLLVAGIETTTNLFTNLVDALIRHPEIQRKLWADTGLAGPIVEEALRYDTSVQGLWRATSEPVELGGVQLPAGARLLVLFGAANRDETVFPDPDTFSIDRQPNPHVAFGFGHHRCLGARLAKVELMAAVRALAEATGGIEPRGPFVRTDSLVLRGFVAQPVTLLPR
jgi:cytochrome P450